MMENNSIIVTGGAGFIGSHLVDRLLQHNNVHVIDNLSGGKVEYIEQWRSNYKNFNFFKLDLGLEEELMNIKGDYTMIFHLAADPDVRSSSIDPKSHFKNNILATFNTLELARRLDIETFVFTSSSTVYGDANIIPTPEEHPLKPISMYGASKAASEQLIISYANMYGIKTVIYRLANVIGHRSNHGVIVDLIKKLTKDKSHLDILGDGTQRKSYIHVDDCINAIFVGLNNNEKISIFNVGADDYLDVATIARCVVEAVGVKDVKFRFINDHDGRGWKGDVKLMLLDTKKIKKLGWKVKYNSLEAVKVTVHAIVSNAI